MKYRYPFALWSSLSVFLLGASIALAGGSDPDVSKPLTESEKGTNFKGQSSDFKSYVNQTDRDNGDSNSIDLMDLGDDTKVAAGGDDPSVGLRSKY